MALAQTSSTAARGQTTSSATGGTPPWTASTVERETTPSSRATFPPPKTRWSADPVWTTSTRTRPTSSRMTARGYEPGRYRSSSGVHSSSGAPRGVPVASAGLFDPVDLDRPRPSLGAGHDHVEYPLAFLEAPVAAALDI